MNAREASRPGPTALLAEDESLLADEMSDLLGAVWPDLRIVARASDGVAALNLFEIHAPDLAFLDIRMPLLDGIDGARHIAGRCHVVFITSYDQHAVEAFEAGAIDYVLKPPTAARLVTTVQRLKLRLKQQPTDLRGTLETFGASAPAARRHLQWINASRGAAVRLITVEEILYFKSDQKYTMVVTPDDRASVQAGAGRLLIDQSFSIAVTGYTDARLERAAERFLQNLSRQTGIPEGDEVSDASWARDAAGQRCLSPLVPADVNLGRSRS